MTHTEKSSKLLAETCETMIERVKADPNRCGPSKMTSTGPVPTHDPGVHARELAFWEARRAMYLARLAT